MILRGPFPFPMAVPAWPVNAPVSGTVALTGVQASVIVNDFNDVLADLAPFAGLQASALLGSVGPSTPGSAPLVGVAGTGQAGTLTANLPLPLVGQQGTGAVGTELPIASYIDRPAYVQGPFPFLPSSGTFWFREKPRPILPQSQSITVILGSVTAAGQVNGLGVKNDTNALAGDVGTGTLGTEIAAFSEPITGVTATGSVGSLGLAQPLTGSSATGQTGTEIANFSVPLTGVTASGQLGVLAANSNSDVTLQLSGVGSTSAIGTLAVTATLAVSGQSATSAIGSLSVTVARLLVGPVATGAIGTPSGSGSGSASLAGVQAAATINPIANVSEIILPPGLAAQGYAGALAFSPATFMVTGVTANGIAGSLSIDEGAVLDLVGQFLPTLDFTGELD
jgi:hypothetical protein